MVDCSVGLPLNLHGVGRVQSFGGLVGVVVFGAVESVITWFDRRGSLTPAAAAEAVALTMVRGVVIRPASLGRLRSHVDRFDPA